MEFNSLEIREIQDVKVNSILASELHNKLKIKSRLTDWLKSEIEDGMFDEELDYTLVWQVKDIDLAKKLLMSPRLKKNLNELDLKFDSLIPVSKLENLKPQQLVHYGLIKNAILILDASKELAMMSKSTTGKEARQYFINVEKIAKNLLGEDKIREEIEQIKANTKATQLLNDSAAVRYKLEHIKMLQDMGVNYNPTSLITKGITSGLPKDIAQALTDSISDIRPAIEGKSTTALRLKFGITMQTF